MERGVPGDPLEGEGVIEDQVGEEPAVLVTAGRVVRKVEPVVLQALPESLGGQGMVLSVILRTTVRALQGPADRVRRFPVA